MIRIIKDNVILSIKDEDLMEIQLPSQTSIFHPSTNFDENQVKK